MMNQAQITALQQRLRKLYSNKEGYTGEWYRVAYELAENGRTHYISDDGTLMFKPFDKKSKGDAV